eukprot:scaffold14178_cov97-Skeletonema_marinoi.AAC.1
MERVAEGPDGGYSVHSESSIHHMPKLSLSRKDAFALIEKLDHYSIFRQGGGWNAYKQNDYFVVADFGKTKDGEKDVSHLTWHYRMFLRIDEDEADDNHCRYCPKEARGCICYDDLKTWWDACEIASLVLPSSGTAERVFSLTKMLFSDRQDRLLFDAMKVSLFTAYNRR